MRTYYEIDERKEIKGKGKSNLRPIDFYAALLTASPKLTWSLLISKKVRLKNKFKYLLVALFKDFEDNFWPPYPPLSHRKAENVSFECLLCRLTSGKEPNALYLTEIRIAQGTDGCLPLL